jgi:geranylgeranyl reductase family protein
MAILINEKSDKEYDVIIVGAGPAGCAAGLALRNSGLNVAVFDKHAFPRHKTCGDAIPNLTLKILKNIIPQIEQEWESFQQKENIKECLIHLPNHVNISALWVLKAYNCKRIHFDDFLFQLLKKYGKADLYENTKIIQLREEPEYIKILTNQHHQYRCKMLIAADGANSIFSRQLNNKTDATAGTAVSQYIENVQQKLGVNEIFLLKDIEGYFWIFPLNDNKANVGFGMTNNQKNKTSQNVKQIFENIISKHPEISLLFRQSKALSPIYGFSLPFGGKPLQYSANRILLTGDAAKLIDPLTGHGIDKAVLSGKYAAEHTIDCFNNNRFDTQFNQRYDIIVYQKIAKELNRNFKILLLLSCMQSFAFFIAKIMAFKAHFLKQLGINTSPKKYSFSSTK